MRKISFLSFILLAVVIISGCSSGKKLLQRGDYYHATMASVNRLRSSPNHKKSQQVLLRAYPMAKENSIRIIQNALSSNMPDKYSIAVNEYTALNNMAESIFRSPKALELIPNPQQFHTELNHALNLAAEEAYELGLKQLKLNTLESAREAYFNFLRADSYVQGYRDVKDKIQESLYMATFKVVVQKPITPPKYQLSTNFFYDNLMSEIARVTRDKFIRFYTYEEAQKERLTQPDEYLVLNFEDFAVGLMRESQSAYEVKRDSVLVGSTTIDGKKHDVYGTVKANIITYRREVISQGVLSAQIVNAYNNRVIERRNLPGKFVWVNEWATFRGDERALDAKQKKLTSTEPMMPPPEQDLFIEFTKPIFDQVVSFVNTYYKRYEERL